jgi:hypothetical protein
MPLETYTTVAQLLCKNYVSLNSSQGPKGFDPTNLMYSLRPIKEQSIKIFIGSSHQKSFFILAVKVLKFSHKLSREFVKKFILLGKNRFIITSLKGGIFQNMKNK